MPGTGYQLYTVPITNYYPCGRIMLFSILRSLHGIIHTYDMLSISIYLSIYISIANCPGGLSKRVDFDSILPHSLFSDPRTTTNPWTSVVSVLTSLGFRYWQVPGIS